MVAIVVLCTTGRAHAQLSLSSAVDLALRNDPKVLAAQADVKRAQAAFSEAHDAYVPTASASGGYGTSTGVPLSVPTVFQLSSSSLLFNFSQKDFVRAAAASVESARLSLQETREKVIEDVVATYLALHNDEEKAAALRDEHAASGRLVSIVQQRIDAGQDARVDLLKARLKLDQTRFAELQIEDDIAAQADHLGRLIGMPGNKLVTVADSIPPIPDVTQLGGPLNTQPDSYGVRAAFANALSKQEKAFGDSRYRFRPQLSFGANYSRISTTHTNYAFYYPAFQTQHSDNAASVGIQIMIPLYDRGHEARAHESAAEAVSARFQAEDQRNQFLEGRAKLQHSLSELEASARVSQDSQDLAEEQLKAIMIQLNAPPDATNPQAPLLNPKDEQTARIDLQQRRLDYLTAKGTLDQSKVNLMRQTRQLDNWLQGTSPAGTGISATVGHK
ncbi:TolC family protein [Bryocella elongata]|nr:TolC family protein [Bryocella elongata]